MTIPHIFMGTTREHYMERISEAQRFTTKVLAERPGVMLPVRETRSVTPH